MSTISQTLIEIDFPQKAYCGLCTDTASYGTDTVSYGIDTVSYGTDTVSYGTDTVSYCTDTVSYGTNTVSYGSSGKKGLPALCSVSSASNVGVYCCTATRTVLSILSHTL